MGDSLLDRVFYTQKAAAAADQTGSTQVRASTADRGLYAKPHGYAERRVDLPGLTRKTIPTPEAITIPAGSQYLCSNTLTLEGAATLSLVGDAELAVLNGDATIATLLGVLTGNGDLLYRNGAGNLVRLPVGSTGNTLTVSGGLPTWQAPVGPWTTVVPPIQVATGGAGVTTIATLASTANKGHSLDLHFSATRTDRSAQYSWKVLATVTNAGGVLTVRDVLITPSGVTPWTVNVTAVAPNIVLTVQGAGATNIDWVVAGSMLVHGS
jgi:hypothetical protein